MSETLGMLDLKIARLEQYLKILKQQQRLSSAYPAHEAQLTLEYLRLQTVLDQLLQRRQEFLQTPLAV
jgi:hypothetical protein